MFCNTLFPLKVDIYYAITQQSDFGDMTKTWLYDQTINASLHMATNYKDQNIKPAQMLFAQDSLNGKAKVDPRISSDGTPYSMTDILLTNIRGVDAESIYNETAGPRSGMPTIYELSGMLPHNGPFGTVDYYKIVLTRSDAQEMID
jgi:hypothetical protein